MKINEEYYSKLKSLLMSFAGDLSVYHFNQEVINRNVFITNVMSALTDIDTESQVSDVNTLMENISNFKIPLTELYQRYGTKEICIEDLLQYSYSDNNDKILSDMINKLKTIKIDNIKISSDPDTFGSLGLEDLVQQMSTTKENKKTYICPIIEYSYSSQENSFSNKAEALRHFYSNATIANSISADENISNTELNNLYHKIQNSYNDKSCILLDSGSGYESRELLQFILNFKEKSDFIDLIEQNIMLYEMRDIYYQLAQEMSIPYLYEKASYELRDISFDPQYYIGSLSVSSAENISYKTFKLDLIKALLTQNSEFFINITNYITDLTTMQDYIQLIQASALDTEKYILEV